MRPDACSWASIMRLPMEVTSDALGGDQTVSEVRRLHRHGQLLSEESLSLHAYVQADRQG